MPKLGISKLRMTYTPHCTLGSVA